MLAFYIIIVFVHTVTGIESQFLGCYQNMPSVNSSDLLQQTSLEQCVNQCASKHYRYAMRMYQGFCSCGIYLGVEVSNSISCDVYCGSCNYRSNLADVYSTGSLGAPKNVRITNITDTTLHIKWEEPEFFRTIVSYEIRTFVIKTYSNYAVNGSEYEFSNNTFSAKLIVLPATKYNITLSAISPDGRGSAVSKVIQTKLGEPDNAPYPPEIMKNHGTKIEVRLAETINNNGPITSYLVVVINQDNQQIFQEELLKSYDEAKRDGVTYYIAAELNPNDIDRTFMVGDGRYYGKYFNAPLDKDVNYNILTGIISKLNGETKRAFTPLNSPKKTILMHDDSYEEVGGGDTPAVIIGLSIAIGLLSFMLVAGIIGFIILKSRVTNRRHRLSDNQELTLQGPMIEVENNGYIPEEEQTKVNHYKDLKQKLKTISFNQLKIEPTNLLGTGRFGKVNSGSVYENNSLIPVAIYTITDKRLSPDDKKSMLKDLDLLIRTGKHENIVFLMGTCETPQLLLVVLEYVSMNLKDLLLGSRDSLPGRFSNMTESQALDIAIGVTKGMAHLEANKIVHKQLCARNILMANGFVPKISGYGLAQFNNRNNLLDYTRWTALEGFRGQIYTSKSDVWSFACLLWEICVLGGTPYGNFSNNEIAEKVMKGLRLPQMQYFSDDLYQIMLNCWQIDMDERPTFQILIETLMDLKENTLIPYLNFNLYSSFQYEQFSPDMEVAVRPVF